MRWGRTHHNEKRIGAHVHIDIWQNQYNIVKLKNKIKKRKKKSRCNDTCVRASGWRLVSGWREEIKLAVPQWAP